MDVIVLKTTNKKEVYDAYFLVTEGKMVAKTFLRWDISLCLTKKAGTFCEKDIS